MRKKILNPLVVWYQNLIAEAIVMSAKKRTTGAMVGGVRLMAQKAEDPRKVHENFMEGHYEYCGRKYPYSSKRQKERHVVPA